MTDHVTENQKVDIIRAYTENLEPMESIAKRYGYTRQGIHKLLKTLGVDTKKTGGILVSCCACGKEIKAHKSRIRRQKNLFCGYECYYAFLQAGNGRAYIQNRHSCRRARDIVGKAFDLQAGHIVHHEDRNNWNNNLSNLRVFANQGDHIRYHRLGADYVTPIWDGSKQ